MPRVVGIDPGTVTFDLCGLDDGEPSFVDSVPTSEVAGDPDRLAEAVARRGGVDAVVGPSGYGLPLCRLEGLDESDLRLAFLSRPGGSEGIPGLVAAVDRLRRLGGPVWVVPGVVHLPTVPRHRKVNRVDMGTADKLCAAALGAADQARRLDRPFERTDFLLVEIGGAFTSVLAVRDGAVVDGAGGSSGPPGVRAPGALDGEVAVLLGRVTKRHVFSGGAAAVAGGDDPRDWAGSGGDAGVAWRHLAEGVEKACRSLTAVLPGPTEILLSGRHGGTATVADRLRARLEDVAPVRRLEGPAPGAGSAAQGAALLADGLAGGDHAGLVDALELRGSSGTVFDHVYMDGASEAAARWLEGAAP